MLFLCRTHVLQSKKVFAITASVETFIDIGCFRIFHMKLFTRKYSFYTFLSYALF